MKIIVNKVMLAFLVFCLGMGVAYSSTLIDPVDEKSSFSQLLETSRNVNLSNYFIADMVNNSSLEKNNLAERKNKAANIPIPAAILLFGPAMLGLMGLSSRRKNGKQS